MAAPCCPIKPRAPMKRTKTQSLAGLAPAVRTQGRDGHRRPWFYGHRPAGQPRPVLPGPDQPHPVDAGTRLVGQPISLIPRRPIQVPLFRAEDSGAEVRIGKTVGRATGWFLANHCRRAYRRRQQETERSYEPFSFHGEYAESQRNQPQKQSRVRRSQCTRPTLRPGLPLPRAGFRAQFVTVRRALSPHCHRFVTVRFAKNPLL